MSQKPRTAKPALSLWVIDNRKRLGWKPADVAARVGVTEDTVRGWEAGRGMSEDARLALEQAFGVPAPVGDREPTSELVSALREQTAEIGRLADGVEALLASRDRDLESLARTLAGLLASPGTQQGGAGLPGAVPESIRPGPVGP